MSSLAQEESRSISENVTWGHRKRFADGKVCVPYRHFLGYDKGPDGNLAANQRCRFLLFQYTMTAQICKEKGEPAYTHGGV